MSHYDKFIISESFFWLVLIFIISYYLYNRVFLVRYFFKIHFINLTFSNISLYFLEIMSHSWKIIYFLYSNFFLFKKNTEHSILNLLDPYFSKKFDLFYFNFVIKLIFIFCTLKISLFLEEKAMYNNSYTFEDYDRKKILKNRNELFTFQWVRENRKRLVFTKKINKKISKLLGNETKK